MFHETTIIGYLGRDPEMTYTPGGQAVTHLNVATNRKYNDTSGQLVEIVNWFRISVWGKQAENCKQYLHKGSLVLVKGTLTPDAATGGPKVYQRQDGTYGASYEVNAQAVRFLSSSGKSNGDAAPAAVEAPAEDIPF